MRPLRTASLAFTTLLLLATGASASDKTKLAVLEGHFEAQKASIVTALGDDSAYAEISREDKQTVLNTLERIELQLRGVESVEQLNPDQRAELFNDQDLVNVLLTRAAKDSLTLCTRRGTLGTHFRVTQCETAAERRRRQEQDQAALHRLQGASSSSSQIK